MSSAAQKCLHCERVFPSTVALRRHENAILRCIHELQDSEDGARDANLAQNSEYDIPEEDDSILLTSMQGTASISEEIRVFYEALEDSWEPVFPSLLQLDPALSNLCAHARQLLRYCCSRCLSEKEVQIQFKLATKLIESCACNNELLQQFPTPRSFSVYVDRYRKSIVNAQGWRRASIVTALGQNRTGVFRSALQIVVDEVAAADGPQAVMRWSDTRRSNVRAWSTTTDSDALREYEAAIPGNVPVLAVDLYADGTTLSHSGSQTACPIRIRPANIRGRSEQWHDVGIAPQLPRAHALSASRISLERTKLFQRFMFLLLQDLIHASKCGVTIEGQLFFIRLSSLVSDQPQERTFLGLKAVGSFMDCSLCMMPSLLFTEDTNGEVMPPEIVSETEHDNVRATQLSRTNAQERSVHNTVSRQLLLGSVTLSASLRSSNSRRTFNRQEIALAKQYVRRVSAAHWPPALAAVQGLGSPPFNLYSCVAFDALHAIDLGISRTLPDMAFTVFARAMYHKNVLTKAAIVRIANQRFADFARFHGIYAQPFRQTAQDVHANMTGSLRRAIVPFLWPVLLGLQPDCRPDDDSILQAALHLDKFQRRWFGFNVPIQAAIRSEADITSMEQIAFTAGASICAALNVPVSTKFHRVMRHCGHHLRRVGCARRGDTDSNETMHKQTKSAYSSTNKRVLQIAPQLLKIRASVTAMSDSDDDEDINAAVLLQSTVDIHPEEAEESTNADNQANDASIAQQYFNVAPSVQTAAQDIRLRLLSNDLSEIIMHVPCDDITEAVQTITTVGTSRKIWRLAQQIRFQPKYEWVPQDTTSLSNPYPFVTIYANCTVPGRTRRFDAISYKFGNDLRKGILQAIFQTTRSLGNGKVAIVRRLRIAQPHPHNTRIVTEFAHNRYAYAIKSGTEGDPALDCVLTSDIVQRIAIVRDMQEVTTRYSIGQRSVDIADTPADRAHARFFELRGVQYTTTRELLDRHGRQ